MATIESLSLDKKISVIRSINYNENMVNMYTLPGDILRIIFYMSSNLQTYFLFKVSTSHPNVKNKLYCIYIDPRENVKKIYKKIYTKLYEKNNIAFSGIYRTKIIVNSYKKTFNIESNGIVKDYISKGDTLECVGNFRTEKCQIFVKSNRTHTIDVNLYWPVDYMMSVIKRKTRIPKNLQILNYGSKNLHFYPYMTLIDVGLRKECTIFLKVRN